MTLKVLYENITRINVGIIANYSYIHLKYSKFCLEFIDFLNLNGYIINYFVKNNNIIVFLKYSKHGTIIKKIEIGSKILSWRFYRYKRLIGKKSFFLKKYKQSAFYLVILYTSKGFMFFETAYFLGIGGQYICQIKL